MNQYNYIIDGMIQFIPGQDMIRLKESPEVFIPLSPACTQLLLIFINNRGVVLSREHILDLFWEQMGSTPSGNSLNAYVSAIRRAFSSLGLTQEAITTVYKVGFVFNPDMLVEPENQTQSKEENSVVEPIDESRVESDSQEDVSIAKKTSAWKKIIVCLICVWTALLVSPVIWKQKTLEPVKTRVDTKECNISYLPFHSGEKYYSGNEVQKNIINRSGFTCKPGGEYFFYADNRVQEGHTGNIYVSYCIRNGAKLDRCKDYMEHLWSYNK